MNHSVPWVEKFRPTDFEHIVLDPMNKMILKNIINTSFFPNLLLYGPPGTGKTTTIINLINSYQEKLQQKHKGLIIHLNASDERGIDIIRNQINQFVNSKTLFNEGMKFVILDEVDYMTKNAQQALKSLIQSYSNTVRFCLMCNYISRIDEGLQNEFIKLRFNQLPQEDIILFLMKIVAEENLLLNNQNVGLIQQLYKSDIRSMVNFMQTNQNIQEKDMNIIQESIWEDLYQRICTQDTVKNIEKYIHSISLLYNINKKNIIKDFFNYMIRKRCDVISCDFLKSVENIMHFENSNESYYVNYALTRLLLHIPKE
jgi:replication factor C subunit 3/5